MKIQQTKDNEWNVVRRVAVDLSVFNELWILTTGPMLIIPVIFAEFSE